MILRKKWTLIKKVQEKCPGLIRKAELQILMGLTAKIFRHRSRWLLFYSLETALELYAGFTKDMLSEKKSEKAELLRQRMFEKSYQLGAFLRKVTGISNQEDLQQLVFLLYRNIGIEMHGELPGEILVSRCYFSNYYDAYMCHLISGMDSGIISGLYGGGKLEFSERITEGCAGCRASFCPGCK